MFFDFLTTTITIIFWFVVLLVPLVVFHEFGHFLMAKLTKTRVPEFGVGIPPRVVGKRWKGVLWSLNSVPLGGFVRIYGDGDAADGALDALNQINANASTGGDKVSKNLKKEAISELKTQYTDERLLELSQNQELDYFLETQGLILDKEWKEQIKGKNLDEEKMKQVKTIIGWEFDGLPKNKDLFFNKPFWAKLLIMLGGVTANFFLAWFILTILLSWFSISPMILRDKPIEIAGIRLEFMSKSAADKLVKIYANNLTIEYVNKDSLADKSGLKPLDKILTLNDQKLNSVDDFLNSLQRLGGTKINLKVQEFSTGKVVDKDIDLPVKEEGKPQLGMSPDYTYEYKAANFWDAAWIAIDMVWSISLTILVFLGGIIKAIFGVAGVDRGIINAVGGPVAIGSQGSDIFKGFGFGGIFSTLVILSINLGVFNLLPVPALDGGRVVILALQKITGKRNRKLEYLVVSITFILLIVVGLVIAVKDINGLGGARL